MLAALLERRRSASRGSTIDLDLRWEIVTARAALGAASDEEIADALAHDDTAKGRQLAETARAARPDQAVKDAAWRRVATDTTISNDLARAIATGWRRARPVELLASTVMDYFAMLQEAWATRSFSMASLIVSRLFPSPLVSEELATITREWLDANPEPAPLHRLRRRAALGARAGARGTGMRCRRAGERGVEAQCLNTNCVDRPCRPL